MDAEPVLRIAVRDYIDREVARAVADVRTQFVTVENARVIAKGVIDRDADKATSFAHFTIERGMALVAILVAAYAVLSK